MKRASSTSVRQSLGMPSRDVAIDLGEGKGKRTSRPPMAGGRPSTAAASQRRKTVTKSAPSTQFGGRRASGRSSMYGQGPSQVKKDPRQLSEKSHQSATIKKLIAFLSAHGYPRSLTTKSLQPPTTKEFLNIFNFLLSMVDDTLMVDGMSITETIPRVLKAVRYPFPVSKNHLLNVGSPHSWPILLGALDFLVDVCNITDRTDEIMFGCDFDEESDRCAKDFEMMSLMYQTYMEYGLPSVEYKALDSKRMEILRKTKESFQEGVDKALEIKQQLDEEIERLSHSSVSALQENLRQMQAEHEQVQDNLNSQLLPGIEQIEQAIVNVESTISQTELQIEECKRSSEELEEMVRRQPMSSKEVVDIKQSIRESHELLDKFRSMVDDWNQQIAELQMKHNRTVSGIDSSCSAANDKLRRLAVVLPDVASLSPIDHDTSKRADPEVLQSLVQHAKTLRHQVTELLQKVASNCSELESRIIHAESAQSTLSAEKMRKQLEIENLQHTLDIQKDALEQKRKMFEDAMKSGQAEKHALEKQLMAQKQRLLEDTDSEKVFMEVKKQLITEQVNGERELGEKQDKLNEHFMAVADLIDAMKSHSKQMKSGVDGLVRDFKQVKMVAVPLTYLTPVQPTLPQPLVI